MVGPSEIRVGNEEAGSRAVPGRPARTSNVAREVGGSSVGEKTGHRGGAWTGRPLSR
jgi:hypothetical protein